MKYNPKNFEEDIYNFWEKNCIFKHNDFKKKKFSLVLPPPNITGNLHIGHAFQQTIMDFLIRFNKMTGKNVLWQPGLDHAGIATQIFIENTFKKHFKYKDKKFLIKKTNFIKDKLSKSIIFQMKKMGNFIDWKNTRFTMDSDFKKSVKKAFVELYRNNLIYKKEKIVNWDKNLKSTVSDLEIVCKNIKTKIWEIKFNIYNNFNEYIIIPIKKIEYIIEISAIIINSNLKKYKKFKNKYVILPIINRTVPIIFTEEKNNNDVYALIPSHDLLDYNFAIKNNLSIIKAYTLNEKTNNNIKIINYFFLNKDYKTKKTKFFKLPKILSNSNLINIKNIILKKLNNSNLIKNIKFDYIKTYFNYRNKNVISQEITKQWYLKTKKLSKTAIELVKKKYIKFIPKKYEKIYINWMNKIEDWCISRQIWWGHKIPAWYDSKKNIYVGLNKKEIIKKYNLKNDINLYKENDVLDTWFSSSLWTFSSLGWPKNTKKLKIFHPTNIIVSGNDIIFFWISKMIIMTSFIFRNEEFKKRIPFKKIYITGLINDKFGKKMSKSNNNVINPIDIINGNINKNNNYYGADSLRLTFLYLSTNNKNINFDITKVNGYKNFCNKLWNASEFIIKNCKNIKNYNFKIRKIKLIHNKWILFNLNKVIKKILQIIKNFEFNKFIIIIYDFLWNKFCNFYIETSKLFVNKNFKKKNNETKLVLIFSFKKILKLLHPAAPFITEKIWQILKNEFSFMKKNKKTIIFEKFPIFHKNKYFENSKNEFDFIIEVIKIFRKEIKIRKINIKNINILTENFNNINILKKNKHIIKFFLNINRIYINKKFNKTYKILKLNI